VLTHYSCCQCFFIVVVSLYQTSVSGCPRSTNFISIVVAYTVFLPHRTMYVEHSSKLAGFHWHVPFVGDCLTQQFHPSVFIYKDAPFVVVLDSGIWYSLFCPTAFLHWMPLSRPQFWDVACIRKICHVCIYIVVNDDSVGESNNLESLMLSVDVSNIRLLCSLAFDFVVEILSDTP
jgi:hypothetical protein